MHNFFIAGLPKSDVAWLSNLFTIGNTYCFNELSDEFPNYLDIREELVARPEEYKGVADTMLVFYYRDLVDTLNEHRLVLIKRPFEEVIRDMTKWLRDKPINMKGVVTTLEIMETKLRHIQAKYENRTYHYRDLGDPEVIEDMWYYLVPGVQFDRQRWEMLRKLSLEPKVSKWQDKAKSENIQSIMGLK